MDKNILTREVCSETVFNSLILAVSNQPWLSKSGHTCWKLNRNLHYLRTQSLLILPKHPQALPGWEFFINDQIFIICSTLWCGQKRRLSLLFSSTGNKHETWKSYDNILRNSRRFIWKDQWGDSPLVFYHNNIILKYSGLNIYAQVEAINSG